MTIDNLKQLICDISGINESELTSKCKSYKVRCAKSMFCYYLRNNKLALLSDIPKMINLSTVSYYEAIRRHNKLYIQSAEYKEQYDKLVYETSKLNNRGRIVVVVSDEGEDVVFYNTSKTKVLSEEELSTIAGNVLRLKNKLNI